METLDNCKHQAMLALQSGRMEDADRWLGKARDLSDSDVDVLQLSAQFCGQTGRFDEAARHCERILELTPDNATAWAFLGNIRMAHKDYAGALTALDKALVLAPDVPMILINRGSALFFLNRHKEAIDCLNRALKLAPDAANAYFNLGRIYKTIGDFARAANYFEQTIKHDPALAEAHINLSGIYFSLGRITEAEQVARNAIEMHPDNFYYRNSLVTLYEVKGEYSKAIEECDIILSHSPGDITALGNKANILERKGDYDQSHKIIESLIDNGKFDINSADVYARICHRFNDCERAAKAVGKLLENETLDEHRRTINFALGHIYHKLGMHKEAFHFYKDANLLSCVYYNPDDSTRKLELLATTFSESNLRDIPRARNTDDRPVFVVGMPRSGTSLIEQILSSHPDVHGAGELTIMNELAIASQAKIPGRIEYPENILKMSTDQADELANTYLDQVGAIAPTAKRIVDKMPHNFTHLGLISRLFPQARIIHCQRDPRDTCLSIYFQSFNQTHAYGADLANLGRYYRDYEKLMDHWRSVIDIPMYEIHYADMVNEQEKYTRELIEFCGLEWDEQCLNFHQSKRDVATASYDQVRRPMYKSSLERWRTYEPWLQPLFDALGST